MPTSYDEQKDKEIDDILWSEIATSTSPSDFSTYFLHNMRQGQYIEQAMERVSECVENHDEGPVGFRRAIERIRKLAADGNPTAMFHMGKFYANGYGVDQDLQQAQDWYLKGAAAGDVRATCNMGWLYQTGFGIIPPDKEKAFEFLARGADLGHATAKASVGVMLLHGEGCVADPARGLATLEEAFAEGCTEAANHIADAYFAGTVIPKDLERAFQWLDQAASRGDARTMAIMGHYLVSGSHGKTDVAKGLALLEQATVRGYILAYRWLGALYERGIGVEQDLTQAQEWFRQGAAAGDAGSMSHLDAMSHRSYLPPELGSHSLH